MTEQCLVDRYLCNELKQWKAPVGLQDLVVDSLEELKEWLPETFHAYQRELVLNDDFHLGYERFVAQVDGRDISFAYQCKDCAHITLGSPRIKVLAGKDGNGDGVLRYLCQNCNHVMDTKHFSDFSLA